MSTAQCVRMIILRFYIRKEKRVAAMKKCNRCGSFVIDSAKFCTECGSRLMDTTDTPTERSREWRASQQGANNTAFQMSPAQGPTKCRKCGITVTPLSTGKITLLDGALCNSCYQSLGFSAIDKDSLMRLKTKTYDQVVAYSRQGIRDQNIAQYFIPTYAPAPYCKFNDRTKKMLVADRVHISYEPKHFTVFSYDQIISYELLEDAGSMASGGLGRAAVGGYLFGGVGAVVGGLTRSYKGTCTRLQIKLTVKDYSAPAFFITIIDSATKKDSVAYQKYIKEAESIISKLMLIVRNREAGYVERPSANTESVADQIRSFKALLDDGIITQEEFDAKKKQLLGI